MSSVRWFIAAREDGEFYWQLSKHIPGSGSVWVDYGIPEKLYFETKEEAEVIKGMVQCWDMELIVISEEALCE